MQEYPDLQNEFDAGVGTFMFKLRCELNWDPEAFTKLTFLLYRAADELRGRENIPTNIAQGFWFCDTWIKDWTSHDNFPRPERQYYEESLELVHDLAYFLFLGESPYEDDTLRVRAGA